MPRTASASGLAVLVKRTAVPEEFRVPIVGPAERPAEPVRRKVTGKRRAIRADQIVVFSRRPIDCPGIRSSGPSAQARSIPAALAKASIANSELKRSGGTNDEAIWIMDEDRSHELPKGLGPDDPTSRPARPGRRS